MNGACEVDRWSGECRDVGDGSAKEEGVISRTYADAGVLVCDVALGVVLW